MPSKIFNEGAHTKEKNSWIKATIPGLEFHDVLRIEGEDHVSAPFCFELVLRIKENAKVPDLIGKPAMVEVLTGKDAKPKDHARYFQGLVADEAVELPADAVAVVVSRLPAA